MIRGIKVSDDDTSKFELSKKMGAALAALTVLLGFITNGITGTVVSGVSSGTADDMKAIVQGIIEEDKTTFTEEELEVEISRRNREDFVDTTIREYGEDIAEIKDVQSTMLGRIEDIATATGANP